jgi:hypothetical protein
MLINCLFSVIWLNHDIFTFKAFHSVSSSAECEKVPKSFPLYGMDIVMKKWGFPRKSIYKEV